MNDDDVVNGINGPRMGTVRALTGSVITARAVRRCPVPHKYCVMIGSGIPTQAERQKERQFLRKGWAKANGSSILPYAASQIRLTASPLEGTS